MIILASGIVTAKVSINKEDEELILLSNNIHITARINSKNPASLKDFIIVQLISLNKMKLDLRIINLKIIEEQKSFNCIMGQVYSYSIGDRYGIYDSIMHIPILDNIKTNRPMKYLGEFTKEGIKTINYEAL